MFNQRDFTISTLIKASIINWCLSLFLKFGLNSYLGLFKLIDKAVNFGPTDFGKFGLSADTKLHCQ